MVFAEFEREMTSRRTSQNAYERGKRGLANGGKVLLGYRRNPAHKGYLLIDKEESAVVHDIFKTYLREKSVRRTSKIIAERYEGSSGSLKRITDSKIHTILTNKAYIGVRIINRRSRAECEEVPAAWKPIIEKNVFEQVQQIMAGNNNRTHRRIAVRRNYLLSGILRCGACGQKMQGKSARSPNGTVYFYYAHKNKCPEGGHDRIEAIATEKLVTDCLNDLATNGERFLHLQAQGRKRLQRRIDHLQSTMKELDAEEAELTSKIESRIEELTATRNETVRESIEKSITDLEINRKQVDAKRQLLAHTVEEHRAVVRNGNNLYQDYRGWITEVLGASQERKKTGMRELLASLTLEETKMKLALSGVNRKEPIYPTIVPAPPIG